MKILTRLLTAVVLGVGAVSSAQAHGDIGWSISVGSQYYAPPVYYSAPPTVYYGAPAPVYYRHYPTVVYSTPSFGYYSGQSFGGWGHRGWRGGDRCERPRRHWR